MAKINTPKRQDGKYSTFKFPAGVGVHENFQSDVIITSVDKLENCLMKHRELLTANRDWLVPLGMILTMVATLVTSTFHKFIFGGDVWTAVFIVGIVVCSIWFVGAAVKAFRNRGESNVEKLIDKIRTSEES